VKRYKINEIFYSIQGEGVNAGRPAIFIRFAGCNFQCTVENQGFDCDTKHESMEELTVENIARRAWGEFSGTSTKPDWPDGLLLVITGGEPMMQVTEEFLAFFRSQGFDIAMETNGSIAIPLCWDHYFDHVCVSPKRGLSVKQTWAHELKFVLRDGQMPWDVACDAPNLLISPAFALGRESSQNILWCVELVKSDSNFRLSVQIHKLIGYGVR